MMDLLVALGLVLFIEGVLFAALPAFSRRVMLSIIDTPDAILRAAGIGSAVFGLILVWMVRR